ncbi:MAG: HAMP domain-containing histidine kinase [Clostridia bacterium]|nr:HAMP domain-containing histidine kinase [Clostridia bacterium]
MERGMQRYAPGELGMAALAHDLRTPMCVASGAAQMALQAGGKDVSRQLEQILQAVRAMDRMLCEAQREENAGTFTSAMLQEELTAMLCDRARQKHQHLSLDLSMLDGLRMEADYGALCRVLTNLLGNAIKYTQPGGEITLRAQMERRWRHDGRMRLRFVISDNGPGMTMGFMRRMYQPYARAKETAWAQGSGLGLSIVKELVGKMGGAIHVQSRWGRGTVFTVIVPVRTAKLS